MASEQRRVNVICNGPDFCDSLCPNDFVLLLRPEVAGNLSRIWARVVWIILGVVNFLTGLFIQILSIASIKLLCNSILTPF